MADYRLYLIDARGRFFRRDDFAAAGDAAATAIAEERRGAHAAELWCGARMLKAFAAPAAGMTFVAQPAG